MNKVSTSGKVAIITGSASGIGYEIARQLCARGDAVVMNDINENLLKNKVKHLQDSGYKCLAVVGDAAALSTVDELINIALRKFGRIDFCIANAGLTLFGDFLDISPHDFDRMIKLNLRGSFFLCQAVARVMINQKVSGKILVISSNLGGQTFPGLAVYSMTKSALQMMSKSLVHDLSAHQITINTLAPGATLTERTKIEGLDYEKDWSRLIPLGKVAKPRDISAAAMFLLSPAADHITGHTLVIDGGWSHCGVYPSDQSKKEMLNGYR